MTEITDETPAGNRGHNSAHFDPKAEMREPFRKTKPEKISQSAGILSRIRKYYSQHCNVALTTAASEINQPGNAAQRFRALEPQSFSK